MAARRVIARSLVPRSLGAAARYWRCAHVCVLAVLLGGIAGCPPSETIRNRGDVLDIEDAVALVNSNSLALQTTLKARAGHASGYFTESNGRKRKFDLDAALLVRPPRCLRLDLSALGQSQLIFGSNNEKYWVIQPGADAITWGRHDQPVAPRAGDLLIRPDLIVEAIGIHPLPDLLSSGVRPIQRVEDDYQQLIFVDYDGDQRGRISKEYWLSRYEPRLVARVVFRDALGEIVMDSHIGKYVKVGEDGPFAPRQIEVNWPANDSYMLFETSGWSMLPMVDETHPGFAFPLDRGEKFRRIVDIDAALDEARHPTPPVTPRLADCQLDGLIPPPALRPLLAVLDFDMGDADPLIGEDLADVCRETIGDTHRYVVMDRVDMVDRLGADTCAEATYCPDESCLIDYGRQLNTQKLVHGKLVQSGETWTLVLRLVDTSEGIVEARLDIALVSSLDKLELAVPAITCELLRDALTAPGEE